MLRLRPCDLLNFLTTKQTKDIKSDLENEIVVAIKSISEYLAPGSARNGVWTAMVKSEIGRIGQEHEYSVVPNETERQWLYDLIWFRNDPNGQIREVALVLESEWSRDACHIHEDFQKLLIAKAPIKVMVFQDHGSNLPDLWRLLKDGIRVFEPQYSDETYILAAFKNEEYKFEIQIVRANEGG